MKTYRIMKALVFSPDEWISLRDVAHDSNLTYRQVQSIVNTFEFKDLLSFDRDQTSNYVKFIGKPSDARKIYVDYTRKRYRIDDNMLQIVKDSMSNVGWSTVLDISAESGLNKSMVSHILSILDDVDKMSDKSVVFYRLK